jgi:hypothetical protein
MENDNNVFSVKLVGFPSRKIAEEFVTFYDKHGEQMFYEWLNTIDLPTKGTMVDRVIELTGSFEVFLK